MNFVERYYRKTRSPFAELLRYFFSALFRLESTPDEDSYKVWMVQILALLVTASWYVPVNLHRRYVELHRLGDAARYRLAYSSDCLNAMLLMTLLIALLTLIEWTELFPSRQDHLVLTPLPVDRLHFFGGSPQGLSADAIHEGATGASGNVYEPFLAACVRPDYLLPAYYQGRNLGESYYLALPFLSWQGIVLGDPLCSLGKP